MFYFLFSSRNGPSDPGKTHGNTGGSWLTAERIQISNHLFRNVCTLTCCQLYYG